MAGKYDEDVYENPYFLKIMSDHPEYLEKIVVAKGILCVPKYSIASSWTPSQEEIEDHVLLPTKDVVDDDDDFITVSNKIVHISDGKLVTKDGFTVSRQVPVLFAETFHTDDGGSYRVFCINGLLNKTVDKAETKDATKGLSPTSYRQCLELLWSHSGGHKMRDSLDKLLSNFAVTYDRLEGETLRSIVDVANTHFTKAMQHLLKDSVVRRSVQHNPYYMDSLKVAVETYLMNSVHKHLFRVITTTMAGQDAEINKITRNLVHLQFSDLGIRKIFSQNIPGAKKELNLLNRYSTPVGRLFCLKRVVAALTKPPKSSGKESSKETVAMMTTDDLLPILIFLIIKSEIPNWMANLVFMRHFHFAKSSDDDEFGFYLASVEAALEHIKTGNIGDELKLLKRELWNNFLLVDSIDGPPSPSSSTSSSSSSQSPSRQLSHSSIDDFFKYVQEGNEMKVQHMLERPYKTSEEVHLKLCHPLCSCDKCDKLLSDFRSNSDLVTAYTRDNRGYTALHIAAYYGQAQLIDLLVQNHAVVDTTDYLGLTPLHLACQRGFQNVMLLLLHFGADVMATDNEGNTPLHLSCANGHDDCVKALVFYEASMKRLHINVTNEFGDTALHLAAKWGYETIVKTLLENGADATICNRKKQTPVSLAQNVKVQRCLQLAAEDPDFLSAKSQQFVTSTSKSRSRASSSSSITHQNSGYTGQRRGKLDLYEPEPASSHVVTTSLEVVSESERKRKREKLYKAVIDGDIQLVKFYLGIQLDADDGRYDDVETAPSSAALSDMCHPLCECEKCLHIQRVSRRRGDIMNVNSKTSTGYCPIHMAVLHNHKDVVALLISQGADVSAQNHKSLTPLHLAICIRNSLVTEMLVKAGARLNVCDINGDTPLLMAASNGFIEGLQILIKAKADLNASNHKGNTALHEAVKRNYTAIVSTLLHAGADPRIRNKHGHLPQDESNDASLRGVVMTAARRLEEAEKFSQNNNNTSHKNSIKGTDGQVSIRDLFAAFEEKDLQKLQSLTSAIRSFDRQAHLKKTKTTDTSTTFLGVLTQNHLIHRFDRGTLRKTKSLCKSEPPHVYSVFKSNSFDTPSTDRQSGDRFSTNTLTSNNQSTDDVSQDSDVSIQESLTPVGDTSFDSESGFDDSLTPLPESESLEASVSDISSEPPENDSSSPVQTSNKADFLVAHILSNSTTFRNNYLTSEVQQAGDVCSISQPSNPQSASEKSSVAADVEHAACDMSADPSPVNTHSDNDNSSQAFEYSNEVSKSAIFEIGAEVMNTVAFEQVSEVTNSPTFEANEVNSSLNLHHGSEDKNAFSFECGNEDKISFNLECDNESTNSLNFECGIESTKSLNLECSHEDKKLNLECCNEDKHSLNLECGHGHNNSLNLECGHEDKNSLNLECGHEDKNSLNLECGHEDKNSLNLECDLEDKNSLIVEQDSEVKYPLSVECDSDNKYPLIADCDGKDKNSLTLQHDTNSLNLHFLPCEDEQTEITSHCQTGVQNSHTEDPVSSQNQQSEEGEYIEQSRNSFENDHHHHVRIQHSSVVSETKELVLCEHGKT
ncbi:hypothetical protein BsWGS_16283 [Bradybaena similaris]